MQSLRLKEEKESPFTPRKKSDVFKWLKGTIIEIFRNRSKPKTANLIYMSRMMHRRLCMGLTHLSRYLPVNSIQNPHKSSSFFFFRPFFLVSPSNRLIPLYSEGTPKTETLSDLEEPLLVVFTL